MENNENKSAEFENQPANVENSETNASVATQATEKPKLPFTKKWWFWAIIVVVVIAIIAGASGGGDGDQGTGDASSSNGSSTLGNYEIAILSCRLAEDYTGKPVVIVKYKFTNNDDDPTAFYLAFDDKVYQDDIGLNKSYILDDSANYSGDNQTKEIKKGASIEVEVAYELNDTTNPIQVEVSELWSYSDKKVSKTFNIK